jgi:1A family penicillin-binding protein
MRLISRLRRLRKHHILLSLFIIAAMGLLGGLFIVVSALSTLPSLNLIQNREVSQSTKIFDRTGTKLLYEIYGEEKRTVIPFEEIPAHVKQATLAIEDANFYEHSALEFGALVRALWVNLTHGGVVQGGSTITQQLAKKAYLSDDRTISRKAKEIVIAYKLERSFTKDEILGLYLNQIPYGNNAYGIEAASQSYFKKSAKDLTLAESALLAAIPNAPSYYSPFGSHVKELLARKNLVLQRMSELGYISEAERDEASKVEISFSQLRNLGIAPHFVLEIKQRLEDEYGEEFVRRAGLKVITTINADMQQAAEKAVKAGAQRNTELYEGTNAAMVVQDPKTGQILAMVGSRDYFDKEIDGQYNVAMQGARQPGSALKPFVYLGALDLGYPEETILMDVETEFNTTNDPAKSYKPHDYDGTFHGPINFRNALAQSVNVPAVKALYLVGIDNFLKELASFGITTLTDRSRFGLSLVLGGGEVHLNELVGAYSVLAQEGVRHEQQMLLSVTDQKGSVLYAYKDQATSVFDEQPVRVINDILSDQNARAPLYAASLGLTVFDGYNVALKTGTTNDYRDAWAMMYTPNLVAGVWAGNNNNVPMQRKGGSILAAVPIVSAFMRETLPSTTPETFTAPDPSEPTDRPMLNGNYIAYFQVGGQILPQIHDILYYVDKRNPLGPAPAHPENDSQFTNWETGVAAWAASAIPGYSNGSYNQAVPGGSPLISGGQITPGATNQSGHAVIAINSPRAGSFVRGTQIAVDATVVSDSEITRIDVYLNGVLYDTRSASLGRSYHYQTTLMSSAELPPQSSVKIIAADAFGASEKESVFYR